MAAGNQSEFGDCLDQNTVVYAIVVLFSSLYGYFSYEHWKETIRCGWREDLQEEISLGMPEDLTMEPSLGNSSGFDFRCVQEQQELPRALRWPMGCCSQSIPWLLQLGFAYKQHKLFVSC